MYGTALQCVFIFVCCKWCMVSVQAASLTRSVKTSGAGLDAGTIIGITLAVFAVIALVIYLLYILTHCSEYVDKCRNCKCCCKKSSVDVHAQPRTDTEPDAQPDIKPDNQTDIYTQPDNQRHLVVYSGNTPVNDVTQLSGS